MSDTNSVLVVRYAAALRGYEDATRAADEAAASRAKAREVMNAAWSAVQTAVSVGRLPTGVYRIGHAYRPEGRSEFGLRVVQSDCPAQAEPMYEAHHE